MSANPSAAQKWTDSYLDSMRQVGDPPADSAVAVLFQNNQIDAVNNLMRTLVENEGMQSDQFPPVIREYLDRTSVLPEWADRDRIEAGERVFWRYGPKMLAILHCYSLPFCYAARKGVQVLALTSRLATNPRRRVLETAQMLVDVLAPGGITRPDAGGVRTAQKVRLMHAAVRNLILNSGQWNAEWDHPINQEDLAGTLQSFSWVVMDGLGKLGVKLTEDETDSYQHCWNVVGHILGLQSELLPVSYEDAGILAANVRRRLYGECKEGREMTAALIEMMRYAIPGDLFDGIPADLIRYFMGEEHAKILGLEPRLLDRLLEGPAKRLGLAANEALRDAGYYGPISEKFSRVLILGLMHIMRGGNRPSFRIPQKLRQQWGVEWTS